MPELPSSKACANMKKTSLTVFFKKVTYLVTEKGYWLTDYRDAIASNKLLSHINVELTILEILK